MMKKIFFLKCWLFLCALLVGSIQTIAAEVKTMTFTPSSTTAGTLTNAPSGVSATFSSSGGQNELKIGKSMKLTLSGFGGNYWITDVILSITVQSGTGTATAKIGNNTIASNSISTQGSNNVYMDVTPMVASDDLVITIAATKSSVACYEIKVRYAEYNGTDAHANTINLSSSAVSITNFSELTIPYDNNDGYHNFYDASSNAYIWKVYQSNYLNSCLQLRSNIGCISAYINSPTGFTLTLDYNENTALVTFDGESITANDNGKTTFVINKTSGLLTILAGSTYCKFNSITLTPNPTTTFSINAACTDGKGTYYGTYSNSAAFIVPADVTISAITLADNKIALIDYAEGDIVAAGEGVLVSSTTAGEKTISMPLATGISQAGNLLVGSGDNAISADAMNADGYYFYHLTMSDDGPGFWWRTEGGAGFDMAAHKAYLKVPQTTSVRGFNLDNVTTAISETLRDSQSAAPQRVFDLQGRLVSHPVRGLYIVDGRKVCIE